MPHLDSDRPYLHCRGWPGLIVLDQRARRLVFRSLMTAEPDQRRLAEGFVLPPRVGQYRLCAASASVPALLGFDSTPWKERCWCVRADLSACAAATWQPPRGFPGSLYDARPRSRLLRSNVGVGGRFGLSYSRRLVIRSHSTNGLAFRDGHAPTPGLACPHRRPTHVTLGLADWNGASYAPRPLL